MQSFKQFLREEQELTPEILERMKKATQGTVRLNDQGKLECFSSFNVNTGVVEDLFIDVKTHELKYQLVNVRGDFNLGNLKLASFKNFPLKVFFGVDAWGNNFSSLEGITPIIDTTLRLSLNKNLTSFANIGKFIKKCGHIVVPADLKSNILGTIMIHNLHTLTIDDNEASYDQVPELAKALFICNEHLAGERDVLECREELVQARLKEYAKL